MCRSNSLLSILIVVFLTIFTMGNYGYPEDTISGSIFWNLLESNTNFKGEFGETFVENFYKKDGWKSIPARVRPQGIDKVFLKIPKTKPFKPLIVEVKTGNNALKLSDTQIGKQMSEAWITKNAAYIEDENIRKIILRGYYRKRVWHIIPKPDGNMVGIYEIKRENGNIILKPATKKLLKISDEWIKKIGNREYVYIPYKLSQNKKIPDIIKKFHKTQEITILKMVQNKEYGKKIQTLLIKKGFPKKTVISMTNKFLHSIKKNPTKLKMYEDSLINSLSIKEALIKGFSMSVFRNIDHAIKGEADVLSTGKRVLIDTLGYGGSVKLVNALFIKMNDKYGIMAWLPKTSKWAQTTMGMLTWDLTKLGSSYFKGDISYEEAIDIIKTKGINESIAVFSYCAGESISTFLVNTILPNGVRVTLGSVTLGISPISGGAAITFIGAYGINIILRKGIEIYNREVNKNYIFIEDLLGILPEELRERITPWELPVHENAWELPVHENAWELPGYENTWGE